MTSDAGRTRVSSGSPFEGSVGFSRAVRAGGHIFVSGTAPILENGGCPPGAGDQARRCFEVIKAALEQADGSIDDVVRSRMYITSPSDAAEVGAVHAETFANGPPAATMVVVAGLLDPRWRVEIEVEAVVGG